MQGSLRQSMSWLHTWVGLLLGWLLYFMFVTGTLAYVDTEIDRWMKPEAPMAKADVPTPAAADMALDYLSANAAGSARWFIALPIDRHDPYPRVIWDKTKASGQAGRGDVLLDPQTGAALSSRQTGGGQALYSMHWRLHYMAQDVAEWLVGVATMFMLVALVSGIVVHKKIFADFFTFRGGKGQRSWLDAHNAASVLTLPFQLMITYSGLVFLMFTYMPLVIAAWYGTGEQNRQIFSDEVFVPSGVVKASGQHAPLIGLSQVLPQVRQHWGEASIRSIEVRNPGDRQARVVVRGDFASSPLRAADALVFDGVDGKLLAVQPAVTSGPKSFRDVMLGLHEGLFAGPVLRALFVLSALAGAAMVASGLILWTVKRRQRLEKARQALSLGLRLVERLNVATVMGLLLAIAAYFWANRLLPIGLAERAEWEMHVLFLTWAAMFLHATLRPMHSAWAEQCWLAAGAFGLLPVLNALTTDRGLHRSLPQGDWVMAGFDLAALTLGIGLSALALHLARGRQGNAKATPQKNVGFAAVDQAVRAE